MVIVGGAWPLLVALTPAADRPWISGTSDNSILSLIFGYNGLGRVAGQSGGPQAARRWRPAGALFGGPTGIVRLLQAGLGDQAGWLLGFALVAGLGILHHTRLRRQDPRTGWLVAVGGALLTTAIVFSFARGIFHPYYVSLLAPFAAALVGGGVGVSAPTGIARPARWLPWLLSAGWSPSSSLWASWAASFSGLAQLILVLGLGAAALLAFRLGRLQRMAAVAVALTALLVAPTTWAAKTLGHAENGTFPTGGPASAAMGGPGGEGDFQAACGLGSAGRSGPPGVTGFPGRPGTGRSPGARRWWLRPWRGERPISRLWCGRARWLRRRLGQPSVGYPLRPNPRRRDDRCLQPKHRGGGDRFR